MAEATGDKTADKITKVSKKSFENSQQNNSETVKNDHDKENSKERYISSEEKEKIIDDLILT